MDEKEKLKKLRKEIRLRRETYKKAIIKLKFELQMLSSENETLKKEFTLDNFAFKFCSCLEKYDLTAHQELAAQIYANSLPMFIINLIKENKSKSETKK